MEPNSLFFEFYEGLFRQGPCDFENTSRAFYALKDLPKSPEILDIACGKGAQTLDLVKLTPGHITSIDYHAPFIESLKQSIKEQKLEAQVTPMVGDMKNLKLDKKFDVIWCEGASYIMGFENCINNWGVAFQRQC